MAIFLSNLVVQKELFLANTVSLLSIPFEKEVVSHKPIYDLPQESSELLRKKSFAYKSFHA